MNSVLSKLKAKFFRGNKIKSIAISIVILIEILAITSVTVFAWVETVSSIKLSTQSEKELKIDNYVLTDAVLGGDTGTIDMAKYFKQSGDMHLAPASSADGTTMFFPQTGSTSAYRKGNTSDKNTNYLSVTFRVKTTTNADIFFTKEPKFSALGEDIRVSVTAQTEGSNEPAETQIYALSKHTDAEVVNSTTGGMGKVNVEAFSAHIQGQDRSGCLFSVGKNETKIVTINVWLQKKSNDMNSTMSQYIKITDLGIIYKIAPRVVTLVPGDLWSKNNPSYYYAWCWDGGSAPNKLFKLTANGDGSYSFEYDGSYQKLCFVYAKNGTKNTGDDADSNWWNNSVYKQTVDLSIPDYPMNPTFYITSYATGDKEKSTGEWEPATVKLDYVTGQENYGTLSATYLDHTVTGTKKGIEILCGGGSKVKIEATPISGYNLEGWYTDAAGTKKVTPTDADGNITAPAKGSEITYYAKFEYNPETWVLKYGASGASSWSSIRMTGTGDTLTCTKVLTEGEEFSFKINETVSGKWYGNGQSYRDKTDKNIVSNATLSTTGDDIFLKGHAGTYTFTFNKSTNVLNISASYSNITITFDCSSFTDALDAGAVISFYDGNGETNMTGTGNERTLSILSTRGVSGSVGFNRWKDANHSVHWANWSGQRGYSTTYKVTGWDGSGYWQ